MQLDVIASTAGMESLRIDWEALSADSVAANPFNTWEWQFLWWKYYGSGHALRVVVARDGARVVGILPLHIRKQCVGGFLPLRVLQPVGVGGDTSPDYLDPLIAQSHAVVLPQIFADFVVGSLVDWDELRMSDQRPELPFRVALERACRARGWPTLVSRSALISYVSLPLTWDEFLQSVSRERRYKVRAILKKFEQMPGTRFFAWGDGARLDDAIDRLIELHMLRWEGRSRSHAFSSDAYRMFHRALMHEFWRQDRLRLYCLEAEGRIIMMFYCYWMRGVTYHFQTGFDTAWAKIRPGHVMMGYLIERAIADGGCEIDFLRGQYDFKADYARETRETCMLVTERTSIARLVWRARALKRQLSDLVRRVWIQKQTYAPDKPQRC